MSRPTLAQLEPLCQKPDFRTSGNWMARRISRPAALRITWVVAPCGFSAHAATLAAAAIALAAACCFGVGTAGGFLTGALLLQLWYLLDHVDGQLARLNGSSSLDGIQLDYLMHHVVNLAVPIGLGYGIARNDGEPWLLLGFAFALGLLLLGLANDTRYKAFIARLKQLEGPLLVAHRPGGWPSEAVTVNGDGLGSPSSSMPAPGNRAGAIRLALGLRSVVHVARKLCEIHVVMNVLMMVAAIQLIMGPSRPSKIYLAVMSPLALITALATLTRDIRRHAAEEEFGTWFAAPDEHSSPS